MNLRNKSLIVKRLQRLIVLFFIIIAVGLTVLIYRFAYKKSSHLMVFNGENAYQHVVKQVGFGARVPGSQAHFLTQLYIQDELSKNGWQIDIQKGDFKGQQIINIIACPQSCSTVERPWIILGAHYDSRIYADHDLDITQRKFPVPGANDGASGVAVLLELARVLPQNHEKSVWLVFFDAEDNGNIEGWEWIMGSTYFVENLKSKPDAAVIVDMVGDTDLNIFKEHNSDIILTNEIWKVANELGYSNTFISMLKYRMIDDHIPFINAGIPAVDIIDFDYPYFHTTSDTIDKVSWQSLSIVGDTLLTWLSMKQP